MSKADNKRILLVEDEESIRNAYSEVLAASGYIVDTAEDGQLAFEKIKGKTYDLILLDVMLPKMDASEILTALKKENALPKSPIVLLTNLAQDPSIKKIMSLGVHSYLLKVDIDPGQLVERVGEILE